VGLVLGFVAGIWFAERVRLGDGRLAWPATRRAVAAVGLAMAIEFAAAAAVAGVWLLGVLLA
jgi:hypothetical protein